jgi:hypothetical protein
MALVRFKHAPLPNPPPDYDPQYVRQLIRVLEIYFNQLDSMAPNQAQSYTAEDFYGSGEHLLTPYNQFTSSTDQTAANTYTAYPVTYDTSDFTDTITLVSSSRITVGHAGVYQFTFSIQFENTTNSTQNVSIWFRKNGTDIASSNSSFGLAARKSAGVAAGLIAVTPFMVNLAANDYIELVWHTADTGVSIQAIPAVAASPGVTPAIPATPSVILTVRFISAPY